MLRAGEVTAMDYWELFCDTGAPEVERNTQSVFM